jgi:hypothetical protein
MNVSLELRNTPITPPPVHHLSPEPWSSSKTQFGHPTTHHCTQTSLLQNHIIIGSISVTHVTKDGAIGDRQFSSFSSKTNRCEKEERRYETGRNKGDIIDCGI